MKIDTKQPRLLRKRKEVYIFYFFGLLFTCFVEILGFFEFHLWGGLAVGLSCRAQRSGKIQNPIFMYLNLNYVKGGKSGVGANRLRKRGVSSDLTTNRAGGVSMREGAYSTRLLALQPVELEYN